MCSQAGCVCDQKQHSKRKRPLEVSQLLKSCSLQVQNVLKVITITHQKVCTVNSAGVHMLRPVSCSMEKIPQQSYQSLLRPDPQHSLSGSPLCHLLGKMFLLSCSSDSLGQQFHPQPQFLTSDRKFMPIAYSTMNLGPKQDKSKCRSTWSATFAFPWNPS